MMRVRLPMRRVALFAALFAVALVVFLPLRVALGIADSGLAAREVSGLAWSGRLKEARAGPLALGDLGAGLSPLPLLIGRARLEVARGSAAPDRFAGAVIASANGRAVESISGSVPVAGAVSALPLTALDLTDLTVRFRDGACEAAEGLVRASFAGGPAGLPGSLSGAARCDRGALLLPLTGGGGEALTLRITGDGRYRAELRLREGIGGVVEGVF